MGDVAQGPAQARARDADSSRSLRRALPAWLGLNVAVALLVAHGYVAGAGGVARWDAWLYAHLAISAPLVACAALLGVLLAGLTLLPGGALLARWLGPILAAALLGFLWLDRAAFAAYRVHVGALAWSALRLPGGLAEFGVWPASRGGLLGAVSGMAVLEMLALRGLAARAVAEACPGRGGWGWLAASALALLLAERGAFVAAERAGRRDVVRLMHLAPFYPVLVGNDLWRWTGPGAPADAERPPASPVRFAADAPRWNVLWIVLDSWRADALSPDLTPAVWEFARRGRVFRSHTSGGDATRYGLVSMLYGVPASAWSRLALERRSPPLLATLRARGWHLGVFSAVRLPDIMGVVFADVPEESRIAVPPARLAQKDRATIDALERFLAAPRADRPYFAFVHLASTHGPYDPACELPRDQPGRRARYERAVRCADRLVARALRAVPLGDTIVVVTSDHGEAFGEHGVHGHAAGFTLPQLRVPLVVYIPGVPPAVVEHPTTHHDLPATLLDALGAESPSPADGVGRSLLAGSGSPWLFACNMNECAIHDAEGSVTFGIGARYPRELEIRAPDGTRLPAGGELGSRRFAQVVEFLALQRAALP